MRSITGRSWSLIATLVGVTILGCSGNSNGPNGSLNITTNAFPNAFSGLDYTTTLEAEGGSGLVWALASGALPDGLVLEASTGVIHGIPTEHGDFPVQVSVTSGSTTVDKPLVLTVEFPDLTGTWAGAFTVNLATGGNAVLAITMELVQTDSTVTGDWFVDEAHKGTVSATVRSYADISGDILVVSTLNNGSFGGDATLDPSGNDLLGQFDGQDSHNTHSGGILHIQR